MRSLFIKSSVDGMPEERDREILLKALTAAKSLSVTCYIFCPKSRMFTIFAMLSKQGRAVAEGAAGV